MKKIVWVMVLLLIPFVTSAYDFCEDGEAGSGINIISVEDALKDNSDEWIWDWGDDVQIDVEIENNLGNEADFVAELIFLDNDEDEVYIAVNNGDLERTITLEDNETEIVSFSFEVDYGIFENVYDYYIKVYDDSNESGQCQEFSGEVTIGSMIFCENGIVDDSDLKITSVEDVNVDNDNDWVWSAGDKVGIEVIVDNRNYDDMNFDVELIFVDADGDEFIIADSASDLKRSLEIEGGTSEEFVFNFTVDNEVGSEIYGFYVVVISDENEDICTSARAFGNEIIEIKIIGDYGVIVSSVNGSSVVNAGETHDYSVAVKNMGASKEDRVSVVAYNANLGIAERKLITNLGAQDSKAVIFNFTFPLSSADTSERISFFVEYDYDENKDYYLSSSSDEGFDKTYLVNIGSFAAGVVTNDTEVQNVTIDTTDSNNTEENKLSIFDSELSGLWIYLVVLFLIVIIAIFAYFFFKSRSGATTTTYYPSIQSSQYKY
jgi:hypothetical protein